MRRAAQLFCTFALSACWRGRWSCGYLLALGLLGVHPVGRLLRLRPVVNRSSAKSALREPLRSLAPGRSAPSTSTAKSDITKHAIIFKGHEGDVGALDGAFVGIVPLGNAGPPVAMSPPPDLAMALSRRVVVAVRPVVE